MKLRRDRYKEGSLRRVPRRSGRDAWEFRYTVMEDGVQKWKQVTVDSKKFPTTLTNRNSSTSGVRVRLSRTAGSLRSSGNWKAMERWAAANSDDSSTSRLSVNAVIELEPLK